LLDPSFDGKYPIIEITPSLSGPASRYIAEYRAYQQGAASYSDYPVQARPENVKNLVGSFSDAHIDRGKSILALIPEELKQELNVSQSAACLIYALFVGCDPDYRQAKLEVLRRALVPEKEIDEVDYICDILSALGDDIRLPLVELAVPSLHSLTSMGKRDFLKTITLLIEADAKVTLFEFTVQWMLKKLLTEKENISSKISFFSYSQVASDILVILNALAWAGKNGNAEKAKNAFEAGITKISEIADKKSDFIHEENISFNEVGLSLNQLSRSSFKIKESVIDSCAHCAFADNVINVSESDLLRVISLTLGCPLPPFLP